jgi:hypothetical protein
MPIIIGGFDVFFTTRNVLGGTIIDSCARNAIAYGRGLQFLRFTKEQFPNRIIGLIRDKYARTNRMNVRSRKVAIAIAFIVISLRPVVRG